MQEKDSENLLNFLQEWMTRKFFQFLLSVIWIATST